jgi:hypothetical protein
MRSGALIRSPVPCGPGQSDKRGRSLPHFRAAPCTPRGDALERMRRHPNGVMDHAMIFDERFDPRGTRENTALGLAALQTALALHHETMAMPVTMLLCEASL